MNELVKLREQLDELREENRQLKDQLGEVDKLPNWSKLRVAGLSPRGYRILCLLQRRPLVHRDYMVNVLWGDLSPDNPFASIAVELNRLRKVASKYQITIENVRGVGWRLDDLSRANADGLIKELTA